MGGIEGGRRVVVTGMGAVTSLGPNLVTTWANVQDGRTGFIDLDLAPSDISVVGQVSDFNPEAILTHPVSIAGVEYPFKKLMRRLSPAAQFAIVATYEALRNAGALQDDSYNLAPDIDAERFGITGGSGIGGAEEVAEITKRLQKGETAMPSSLLRLLIERGATFSSIMFGAKGPVNSVSLACATGGRAINDALREILVGDAEIMVANAGENAAHPIAASLFTNTRTTSPTDASRPFDQARNGFVLGEGGGAIVLESLDHALRRGVKPIAEITGYGNTADAWHESDPSGEGAVRAIQIALKKSGGNITGRDILVKAHATGTINGDPVEARSIKEALPQSGTIYAFAPKSQLGHTLGAAGMIEAIIAIKAIEEGVLPPTVNLTDPIPETEGFEFAKERARAMEGVNIALANSFGFGGGNAVTVFDRRDDLRPMREI